MPSLVPPLGILPFEQASHWLGLSRHARASKFDLRISKDPGWRLEGASRLENFKKTYQLAFARLGS